MNRLEYHRKIPLQIFILNCLGLAGFGVSFILARHFYQIHNGSAGFKSFCNLNSSMNCDVIAASPYAEFILGLPIASFSAGWFLALFLISLVAHKSQWRREAIRFSFGLVIFGTLTGLAYFFIMAAKLKTYCLLCLVLDGINIAAFINIITLRVDSFTTLRLDLNKWKIFVPISVVALFGTVIGLSFYDTAALPVTTVHQYANAVLNSPSIAVNHGDEFPSIGPKDAPIQIVEFSDYQCPFCRMGAFVVNSVVNHFPGKVRIIFRNFPLDPSCNSRVHHSMHPSACDAARVAYCAHLQGKFEPVYQKLFEEQSAFVRIPPIKVIQGLGLDETALEVCVKSPMPNNAILKDIEEANSLQIQSTPTFFINGHRVDGPYPVPIWIQVIETILAGQKNP